MVWVGKDLKGHLIPTPLHGQGHLLLDQVAQSPIQPGLEHFQGGGTHNFSRQPVPVPHQPRMCMHMGAGTHSVALSPLSVQESMNVGGKRDHSDPQEG